MKYHITAVLEKQRIDSRLTMSLSRKRFLGTSTTLSIEIRYDFTVDVVFAENWQSTKLRVSARQFTID